MKLAFSSISALDRLLADAAQLAGEAAHLRALVALLDGRLS